MAQPEPLQHFFGAYNPTEAEMRQILEDAADEAERNIPKLVEKHTTGATLKAAQLQLILREVRAQQSAMWGDLSGVIHGGMERASLAGVEGQTIIERYLAHNGLYLPDLRKSFQEQAKRGLKHVLAKGLNNIPLSTQVYRTQALAMGWVDRQIRSALILQTDARTLARQVRDFIDPSVKGGVSFAAFRLARSELNNAFHTAAIERADEPWSAGMQWHLSGSHPPGPPGKPEICETYARVDEGLGIGVFPHGEVPKKPHPQCLCYVTQQVVDEDTFLDNLLAGTYDGYLNEQLNGKVNLEKVPKKPLGNLSEEDVVQPRDEQTELPTDAPDALPSQEDEEDMSEVLEFHFDSIIEYSGKRRDRIMAQLQRQAQFGPRSAFRLTGVLPITSESKHFNEPGILGFYNKRSTSLFLSDKIFQAGAQVSFNKEKETNWISRCGDQFDCLDDLVAHEYGHHSHDLWLEEASREARLRTWRGLASALHLPAMANADDGTIIDWVEEHKASLSTLVSRYGASNPIELLAEIWKEYTLGDPPRPHIAEAGLILSKIAEEHA
jgi:hypothetical protein